MIFEKAKKIVGKRLGDLDLQLYRDIVGGFLIESICDLAVLPDTRTEDIKGLIINKSVIIDGDLDLSGYSMLRLRNLYSRSDSAQRIRFTELSQDMFSLVRRDTQVEPVTNEVFWCKYDNIIQFYKSSVANGKEMYLQYIANPRDYKNNYNLDNVITIGFQYRAINLAVTKIRQYLGVQDAIQRD